MRHFMRIVILVLLFCFLFSNCSFALRSTAYDESARKIETAFGRLPPSHQDLLIDVFHQGRFPLPDRDITRNIIAQVLLGELTVDDATEEFKKVFPSRGEEEETIQEALRRISTNIGIADATPAATALIVPGIKTGDEILAEMISHVKEFCDSLDKEVEKLLARKKRDIAERVEMEFREIQRRRRVPAWQISALRYVLGERLLHEARQPALALRVLDMNIPEGEGYPSAFIARYRHLLGMVYESRGHSMLMRVRTAEDAAKTKECLLTAEENFGIAIELLNQEKVRLGLLELDPDLKEQCYRALNTSRYLSEADRHLTNYKIISVLGLVPPAEINQQELAIRGRRAIESGPTGDESWVHTAQISRTIVATFMVLRANNIELNDSLRELAVWIIRTMLEKRSNATIYVRRLERSFRLDAYLREIEALPLGQLKKPVLDAV